MENENIFSFLKKTDYKPRLFGEYTAATLWTDPHISEQMLNFHLDPASDLASRSHAFIDRSSSWIADRFGLGAGIKVLDLGCGPGLYASRFAAAGARVCGVDFSPRSLEYATREAARKHLNIDYRLKDYLAFECDETYDLVTLIFCDYCPLSPGQRQTLLRKIYGMLNSHGHFLLDVSSVSGFRQKEESSRFGYRLMDGFWAEGDYYGFFKSFKYSEELVSLDKYTIVQAHRYWEVFNWIQYFDRESLAQEFAGNGFEIIECFSNVAGDPFNEAEKQFAVIAVKK